MGVGENVIVGETVGGKGVNVFVAVPVSVPGRTGWAVWN